MRIRTVAASVLRQAPRKVGALYNRIGQVEKWMRRIAGVLFVAVGIYLSLIYAFGAGL